MTDADKEQPDSPRHSKRVSKQSARSKYAGFESRTLSREQFDRRVASVYKPLYSYAMRAVGPNDCEDLVVDALIHAWQRRNDFVVSGGPDQVQQDFANWLLAILKFKILTFVRYERDHPMTTLPASEVLTLAHEYQQLPPDFWEAQRAEILHKIAALVLTPRERECTCAWVNGRSLVKIGQGLEPPMSRSGVRHIIAGVEALYRSVEAANPDERLAAPTVENLPTSEPYYAPEAVWDHKPWRPDRHARARSPGPRLVAENQE